MNAKSNTKAPLGSLTKRLILAPQSAGRIGKSTVAEAIIEFLDFAKVDSVLFDLDAEHTTLSNRFEDATVFTDAVKTDDGWDRLMATLPTIGAPVIIADMPAQATDFFLRQLAERNGLEQLDRAGVRMTVLLFAADDTAAMQSAVQCVKTIGDRADYIVVRQPGPKNLYAVEAWEQTALGKRLAALHAQKLELPELTRYVLEEYQAEVKKQGRWLSFAEAAKSTGTVAAMQLEAWRNHALVGCFAVAEQLVPDLALIQRQPESIRAPKYTPRDRKSVSMDLE